MLAWVAGVTASLLVALAVVLAANPGCACTPRLTRAWHGTREGAALVEQFKPVHDDRCPRSFAELRDAGIAARDRKDPWGRPYMFLCREDWVVVCSLGKDDVDPADDICSPGLG